VIKGKADQLPNESAQPSDRVTVPMSCILRLGGDPMKAGPPIGARIGSPIGSGSFCCRTRRCFADSGFRSTNEADGQVPSRLLTLAGAEFSSEGDLADLGYCCATVGSLRQSACWQSKQRFIEGIHYISPVKSARPSDGASGR
jgi:hypothetical protein